MARQTLRDDLVDWSLAIAIAGAALLQQRGCGCNHPAGRDVLLTLLITLPLGLRRRLPVPVFFVIAALTLVHLLLGFKDGFMITFAVMVAVLTAADRASFGWSVLVGVSVALGLPLAFAIDWINQGKVVIGDIPYNYIVFAVSWVLGDTLRRGRDRTLALEERNLRLEAAHTEQERRARTAVADERARIARELHDLVTHALSVIVLQAGAARRIAGDQPERARTVLGAIEALGREAVADLRRVVGILRTEDGPDGELEPQPSLLRLGALVEQVRAAGLEVTLDTEGDVRALPPGVDLSAYRIVQEALTNVLRHARARRADVMVRYGQVALEIQVADDGRGPVPGGESGNGLIGMRERVAMFGGRLELGARDDGGFLVRASLPLDAPAPAPA